MRSNEDEHATFEKLRVMVEGTCEILNAEGVHGIWEAASNPKLENREMHLSRKTPNGTMSISFIFWWNDLTKCVVRAKCHNEAGTDTANGAYNYFVNEQDQDRLKINMSIGKAAKAAAQDLKRRLLPAYEEIWAKSAERLYAHRVFESTQASNAALLAAALGVQVNPKKPENLDFNQKRTSMYGDLQVSDKTVTLKLQAVPINLALALCRIIGAQDSV